MNGSFFFKCGVALIGVFLPLVVSAFSDVASDYWHFDAVDFVSKRGIMSGYSDLSFKPNKTMNRAEFMKVLVESAFEKDEVRGGGCFKDVGDEWFAKYICTAKEKGVIEGYPDGFFRPEREIDLAEAAKILVNVFELETLTMEDCVNYESLLGLCGIDGGLKYKWSQDYFFNLAARQIMPQTLIAVDQKPTRAEIAFMINKIMTGDLVPPTYEEAVRLRYDQFAGGLYVKSDDGRIVYEDSGKVLEMEGADFYSFELLDFPFARDKNYGYHFWERIEGSDGRTFELLDGGPFSKDRNHVFYDEYLLPEADAGSFEFLGYVDIRDHTVYAKDANKVFYGKEILDGADAMSFEMFEKAFARDKDFVYYKDRKIEGANVSQFKYLGNFYGSDGENVYFRDRLVENVDVDSFEVVLPDGKYFWAKDKDSVFAGPYRLENVDVNSFEPSIDFSAFTDKNGWHFAKRGADLTIFEERPIFEILNE